MKKLAWVLITILVFPALAAAAALLEGTVVNIDKSKNEIVLNTDRGEERVDFNSQTTGADKVKPGDRVKIAFTQKGEQLIAHEVVTSRSESPTAPVERPASRRQPMENTSKETK